MVLSIRSLYQRAADDWAPSCARRGVAGTCQPTGLVSDVIGKPIATIDSQRRLAGVLEYDPFGLVNRSTHWGEVAPHPSSGCFWLTTWMRAGTGPLTRELRTLVPRADIGGGGCIGQYKSLWDGTIVEAPAGNPTCGSKYDFKSAWSPLADNEGMHFLYCSWDNGVNVNPQPHGVAVQGFEYRKYEAGATHRAEDPGCAWIVGDDGGLRCDKP